VFKRRFLLVLAPLLIFLFGGCSEKNYFEPTDIKGAVHYDGTLPAKIVEIGYAGATLANGQVVTKRGLSAYRLPEGYRYVGGREPLIVAAGDCKPSILYDTRAKEAKELKLPRRVVAALLIPGTTRMAFVLEGNSYGIYDYRNGEIVAKYTATDPALSADIRIANPVMLDRLVLIPTLDGRLVILDKTTGAKIREIVVGKGEAFNNVIYLNIIGDRLVAATPHRIISVSPKVMDAQAMEISDVVFVDDAIYILSKEGTIYYCDTDLKILGSRKFPFAHFVGMIYGEFIYVVEREGYIIATDRALSVANVFELPDKIEGWFFTTPDTFYYEDHFFRLNKGGTTREDDGRDRSASSDKQAPARESRTDEADYSPKGIWKSIKSLFTPDKSDKTVEGAD